MSYALKTTQPHQITDNIKWYLALDWIRYAGLLSLLMWLKPIWNHIRLHLLLLAKPFTKEQIKPNYNQKWSIEWLYKELIALSKPSMMLVKSQVRLTTESLLVSNSLYTYCKISPFLMKDYLKAMTASSWPHHWFRRQYCWYRRQQK